MNEGTNFLGERMLAVLYEMLTVRGTKKVHKTQGYKVESTAEMAAR